MVYYDQQWLKSSVENSQPTEVIRCDMPQIKITCVLLAESVICFLGGFSLHNRGDVCFGYEIADEISIK